MSCHALLGVRSLLCFFVSAAVALFLGLFGTASAVGPYTFDAEADRVVNLPDAPVVDFDMFAGYGRRRAAFFVAMMDI